MVWECTLKTVRSEGYLQRTEERWVFCKENKTIGSMLGLDFCQGDRFFIQGFWQVLMHQRYKDHRKKRADKTDIYTES